MVVLVFVFCFGLRLLDRFHGKVSMAIVNEHIRTMLTLSIKIYKIDMFTNLNAFELSHDLFSHLLHLIDNHFLAISFQRNNQASITITRQYKIVFLVLL